jgi:hypothetical protein
VHHGKEAIAEQSSSPHGGKEEKRENACSGRLPPSFPFIPPWSPAYWMILPVRLKLFNEARIDEKENELTSTDWMGLY